MSQNEARNEKLHRSFELIEDEFIVEASPQNAKPIRLPVFFSISSYC